MQFPNQTEERNFWDSDDKQEENRFQNNEK